MSAKALTKPLIELSDKQKEKIIADVLKGNKLINICKEMNLDPVTLFRITKRDPLFAKDLQDARINHCDIMTDELLTIYDHASSMEDVQRARGQSDNIKWLASKRSPDKYGDNLNLNVKHTVDLTKVLEEASNRISPYLRMKEVNPNITAAEIIAMPDQIQSNKKTE